MERKPKAFLLIVAFGFAFFLLGALFGQQKGDIWWKLMDAGWYVGVAAIILHAILLPTHIHPMALAMKIAAVGFGLIAFGGLFPKEVDDVMWSIGSVIMVIGIILAFFGVRKAQNK